MRNFKKVFLFLALILVSLLFSANYSHAETKQVGDNDSLVSAIQDANEGDVIELTADISLIAPIEITDKNFTINGGNHIITREERNWTPNDRNSTLITVGAGATVSLVNLTLKDSEKYGVQAYNGGKVILNNVSISNCKFGGVLINGGTVEIISLHLGRNGGTNNNGIEVGQGAAVTSVGGLIMNGELTSTEPENVIYFATEDEIIGFNIENSENSTNKVLTSGNKVVVTDAENNVIFESNENPTVQIQGENYVPTPEPAPEPTPESAPTVPQAPTDTTPTTGIDYTFDILLLFVSIISLFALYILNNKQIEE